MTDKTPLQLMDLPYDMLEEIFITLMQIDWTGADFAICSKATLKLLLDNVCAVGGQLLYRPWYIEEGTRNTMRAIAGQVLLEDRVALHSGLKHLRTGRVQRLELICIAGGHYHLLGEQEGPYAQTTDEELETMLGDWPVNKVVLTYW